VSEVAIWNQVKKEKFGRPSHVCSCTSVWWRHKPLLFYFL